MIIFYNDDETSSFTSELWINLYLRFIHEIESNFDNATKKTIAELKNEHNVIIGDSCIEKKHAKIYFEVLNEKIKEIDNLKKIILSVIEKLALPKDLYNDIKNNPDKFINQKYDDGGIGIGYRSWVETTTLKLLFQSKISFANSQLRVFN